MDKTIAILGSTGSIGVQTLEVVRQNGFRVSGLTADSSIDLLENQVREFGPEAVAVRSQEHAAILKKRLTDTATEVLEGPEGIAYIASMDTVDTVVNAIVGIAGLLPTVEAVKRGRTIAIANKETLVTAGHLIIGDAQRYGARIIPVDSEHSAVFQCMACGRHEEVSRIILTASGGPFRGKSKQQLSSVTIEDALRHPNWSMGRKITIDSATLMNKGLEVIEARWLFGVEVDKIEVVVHPRSIVHSMVEYVDGTVIAQMSRPDMRLAIQYALTYPHRCQNSYKRLDLVSMGALEFEKPDTDTFPCLKLAYEALMAGGTMPAVLNGANETAVGMFLESRISFSSIPFIVSGAMESHSAVSSPSLDDIIEADAWARQKARFLAEKKATEDRT